MEKGKLIKGLIYIAIIITLCTVASKIFFKSGETLQEYAQNNPELAYAVNDDEENDTKDDNVDDTEDFISPERVTYKENFYYEPLSEELRLYITGTSFPASTLNNALNKPQSASDSASDVSDDSIDTKLVETTEPAITYDDLYYVHVMHYNFDGEATDGELICNKAIAGDLVEIFYELYKAEYQIEKIRLIDEYGGDRNMSMADNNTYCFNYNMAEDSTNLSKHAYGLAIDINPYYNPCVEYNNDGTLNIVPAESEPYADRSAAFPYKIDENDLCLKLFKEHGFTWGGDRNSTKDYQHLQKVIE